LTLKIVTYHYVRTSRLAPKNFPFLDVTNFGKQLDYFKSAFKFADPSDLASPATGIDSFPTVLLTFDDGLKDHYKFVLPLLDDLGIKGCFFVNSLSYEKRVLLDVHRIHLLLSKLGGRHFWSIITSTFGSAASPAQFAREFADRYSQQNTDPSDKRVKFFLNYKTHPEDRDVFLGSLIEEYFGEESVLAQDFYLDPTEIVELRKRGHAIGAHSHSHFVLANENMKSQREDIVKNKVYLENLLNERILHFCYPFGRDRTYNQDTVQLLNELDFRFAFAMRHKDVSRELMHNQPLEIPRYDCNVFPFGTATILPTRTC